MADDTDQFTSSPTDRDMAIRTMIGEENTPAGMAGVASTMLNRARSGNYGGNSLAGVALAPGQFESWSRNRQGLLSIPPTDPRYQQAAAIFDGVASGAVPDMTGGATHFYAPAAQKALGRQPPTWDDGKGKPLGNTLFFAPPQNTTSAPAAKAIGAATANKPAADLWAPDPAGPNPLGALYAQPSASPTPPPTSPPADRSAGPWDPDPSGPNPLSALYAAPAAPSNQQPPAATPAIGANDAIRSVATGIPLIGGVLNKMDAGTNAALAPVLNRFFSPQDQLQGDTFGERYANSLAQQNGMDRRFEQGHPVANNILGTVGAVGGMVPAVAAAPEAFGLGAASLPVRAFSGAVSNALVGGTDAAIRSGGDTGAVERGALWGGAGGAGGVALGAGLGAAGGKVLNLFSRTSPAARAVSDTLASSGLTSQDAQTALNHLGSAGTLADVDPALTTEAGALAARGGATTSLMKSAMATRAAGADDSMAQIVNDTLGPKPNAQQILNDIRSREISNNVDLTTARAALDNSMGQAADPHAVLQDMLAKRSAAAQPLYEKALSNPVVWDKRLQQFLDDPIVQGGLAKGAGIQRLESLADGTPFNPNDYVFMGKGVKNDPDTGRFVSTDLMGNTPNMQTLNVVKKGLDAMVEDAKDPVTGRLSQEGVAIDKVRGAFLGKLDQINPDYAAARQAWAGPTVTQQAFNRGLNIFRSQSGSSGIATTPGALDSWIKGASDGEKEAAKLGSRTAFQQQMASSSDPAARAAMLAGKQVNQQKLGSILGPGEASNLAKQLSFKYEDPVGAAFSKGLDVFKSRQGIDGVEDTPDALRAWLKGASPAEREAHQQGARQAIEQALTGARQGDVSAARSLFAKSTANREKLESVFPKAGKMLNGLDSQLQMRSTEQNLLGRSKTAEGAAAMQRWAPQAQPSGISNDLIAAGEGMAAGGPAGALAATVVRRGVGNLLSGIQQRSSDNLAQGVARGLVATGPERGAFMNQLSRAAATTRTNNVMRHGADAIGFGAGQYARNRLTEAAQ